MLSAETRNEVAIALIDRISRVIPLSRPEECLIFAVIERALVDCFMAKIPKTTRSMIPADRFVRSKTFGTFCSAVGLDQGWVLKQLDQARQYYLAHKEGV